MRALFVTLAVLAGGLAFGQGISLPNPQIVDLDNGVVLIVQGKRDVPLIGISAVLRGGAVTDPEGKAGLSSLFASLLEKGAGERDAAAFAESLDAAGASLSVSAGRESVTISGDFLARDAGLAIELLVDMLRRPSLEKDEFEKLRQRQINLIRAAKDSNLQELLPIYGSSWLFSDHPYGSPVSGDEASLADISHEDVLAYYEDFVGADRLVISVVGDIMVDEVIASLTESLADWRAASRPLPDVEALEPQSGRRVLLVDQPGATQSYFWIGNVGVSRNYARRAELDIADTLFGGRVTSMLFDEMRTRAGLTYGAYSALKRPARPGSVAMLSSTQTATTIEAIDLAISLLARLHAEGFDDELIASGKNYVLGQFPPTLETSAQLARQLASLEAAGFAVSYINEYLAAIRGASGEDVHAVIADVYPRPDDLVFVVIGNAALIREELARYGPVTEMSITEPRFSP